jgi:transposase
MKIILTPEEKQTLEFRHQHESDGRVRDRIKSVLLREEGWSLGKIAQALRLHNDTVSRYVMEYLESQKLNFAHKGSPGKLSDDQSAELIAHLKETLYVKAVDIAAYVQAHYDVTYTVAGLTNWLKRNGFSYKNPKGQPAKADPEKQQAFVDIYQALKEKTPENEPILFIDAVHPTMATKTSRGWIQKGIDRIIATTASRTRLNIIGAIELSSMKIMRDDYDTINADSVILFLQSVKASYPAAAQIHIILDQSGYHRSVDLREYAEKNGIKLNFLPPYSPNLNPIERLWKVMNETVRDNYFFKSEKDFRERIGGFFETILPEIAESLRPRINDNFQLLNAAK